jgi:hypothetical protein
MTDKFTSEDDLDTFEGWLRYQFGAATMTPDDLCMWRDHFESMRQRSLATPKVGRMKFSPTVAGEHRYAVAVRDGSDLWLTLWVRRSPRPDFYILIPRSDPKWNPHTSYHLDGTLHMKTFGGKALLPRKRQPLTGPFRGTEHLGVYKGHGLKGVGAICDPTDFSGVMEVAPGVLGPRDGGVLVDLVEPGREPAAYEFGDVVQQQIFQDALPWVAIRVIRDAPLGAGGEKLAGPSPAK